MHYSTIFDLLILLMLANGSPVIAKRLLGTRYAQPVDGNSNFVDGWPLFGYSKTIRGVLASVLVSSAAAPWLGLSFKIGVWVGGSSVAGDLFSSFLKRRFCLAPSSRSVGLDQIPESLFPLLVCRDLLELTFLDITLGTGAFLLGELLLSRLLFKLHIRDRPY